jgi:hypothetical protein
VDLVDARNQVTDVSSRPDGGKVVAWVSLEDEERGVWVRFVDAIGAGLSTEKRLATYPSHYEGRASVAAIGSEQAVVVWNQIGFDGSDDAIVGRIVGIGGTMSDPFLVNTETAGPQRLPVVASDLEGDFVVAWASEDDPSTLYRSIYAQRFDRHGNRLGSEFQVSGATYPSHQDRPEIAMDSLGNFVITYFSSFESENEGEDTFLRAYRADGTPYGPPLRANDEIAYDQINAKVAFTDSGLIQVTYQSWRELPGDPWPYHNYDILTRRLVLPCIADSSTLCLQGGRFQVRAFWRDYADRQGAGKSVPLGDDSGGFWFFAPDNFELLVKVIDGCGANGRFWFYSAGLTDVDVDLLVTDTWTGQVVAYANALGVPFSPFQTIDRLEGCGAGGPAAASEAPPPRAAIEHSSRDAMVFGAPTSCVSDSATLCLEGGRFRARATWLAFSGAAGQASTLPFGDDSGLFWFFAEDNVELSVKVLDGCEANGHYWVYASGLTNLAIDLEVEDTVTGQLWSERTELGEAFPSRLDSSAFALCD